MNDLHDWPTPNGWKAAIMLEDCGLEYSMIPAKEEVWTFATA